MTEAIPTVEAFVATGNVALALASGSYNLCAQELASRTHHDLNELSQPPLFLFSRLSSTPFAGVNMFYRGRFIGPFASTG
jgi:hypothetical protein